MSFRRSRKKGVRSRLKTCLKGLGLATLIFAPMIIIIPLGVFAEGLRSTCRIEPRGPKQPK